MRKVFTLVTVISFITITVAAQRFELNTGWKIKRISETAYNGIELSSIFQPDSTWIDATVPGTVLTAMLNNRLVPDPFIGLNNAVIPDISEVGRDYYSFWFHNTFYTQEFPTTQQIWLDFRGVNYSCNIFLNGHKLNNELHEGMFLRQRYNITRYINQGGSNKLAVAVMPPNHVGLPNGGQGGDGTIARNVTMQFTAGWDWIEPVADRNTGIWDKVAVEITGSVDIRNPLVITSVPGIRVPGEIQSPAMVTFSAELHNTTGVVVEGVFSAEIVDGKQKQKVQIQPGEVLTVTLKEIKIKQPRLWWPNGIGNAALYEAQLYFESDKDLYSDIEHFKFGIREFSTEFDEETEGRIFMVNGQKVFIKGGNWIASDALLRLSPDRYNAEVKLHAAMNMNMIRIWGGSITERPEFYEACDEHGIMVWQDLWITGDCNGRWPDPKKTDNQEERRKYPDDYDLFIRSVTDQVKMLRNHPSLVMWCGGNEFPPPPEIDNYLKDSLFPALDPGRFYLSESTGAELMTNPYGGTGDGPYSIMEPSWFFQYRSFPFNAEIGSVGLPEEESLRRILSPGALVVPDDNNLDQEWQFHKYLSYKDFPARYGPVQGFSDFVQKAQMVNYEQYRAMQEGQNARMWEWYTGMLVWKNQNPWSALRGQFYDVWLQQNAAYYGYMHAAKPFHVQLNLDDSTLCVINSSPKERADHQVIATIYDISGRVLSRFDTVMTASSGTVSRLRKLNFTGDNSNAAFIRMQIKNSTSTLLIDENTYWLNNRKTGNSVLTDIGETDISIELFRSSDSNIDFEITNTGSAPAAFIRLLIAFADTGEVLAPVIWEDNYISLMPGEKRFLKADISLLKGIIGDKPLILKWKAFNVKEETKLF